MKYKFICPIEGCSSQLTTESDSKEEAVDKLTEMAKNHLKVSHPDLNKSDEQVRNDINSLMTSEE